MSKTPPQAERRPHVTELHGARIEDPWFWLRDRDDPAVRPHLEAENRHTQAALSHLEGLRKRLFDELLGRVQEDDRAVPAKEGPYLYYWRTEKGRPYVIYARAPVEAPDDERIVLDVNQLARGHEYTALGAYEVGPSHRKLAYSVDHEGDERHALRFVDLEGEQTFEEQIEDTSDDVAWIDDQTVLYVTVDEAERPYRVWQHVLGTEPAQDRLLFEEKDPAFYVGVQRTRTGNLVLVSAQSAVTSEVHVLFCERPQDGLRVVRPRKQDVEYDVDHLGDRLFVRTNDGALHFRLEAVPLSDLSAAPEVIVPERPGVTLEGFELFAEHLVWIDREDGLPRVRVRGWSDGEDREIRFDDPAYDVWLSCNLETSARQLRLVYTSLVEPPTTYDVDLETGARTLLRRRPVPGYDKAGYVAERVWATAEDGVRVPISLARRADTPVDGTAPLLVHGYGAYGAGYDPAFDSDWVSLMDRGLIVAIAHVRGGGDLGRAWKDAGRLAHKPRTFTDFIGCVEHLISEGYGDPARVALEGRSAGGLLVGAVLNLRPDLFAAAIAGVPFVDVTQTLLDATLPLTAVEWEEWGNPEEAAAFETIHGYSPYENVSPAGYPATLATAGLNDPRVSYWEPAKWVLALRDAQQRPEAPILLKVDLGAGHGGQSGRYGRIEDQAFEQAFLLDRLGATERGRDQG